MIPIYREKRDRMLTALAERCSRYATWTQPEGEFFIWVKLGDAIDPAKLPPAIADERVAVRPGTQFFPEQDGHDYFRLCFSTVPVPDIEEGIRRLGRALDQSLG